MTAKGGAPRWTIEQLDAHIAKRQAKPAAAPAIDQPKPAAAGSMDQFYALGRLAKGKMNKTEAAYAQLLAARKHDGTILDWKFHVLRIRLADNTFYEPDFLVLGTGGQIEIHETKGGYTTQAGQTKLKLCAEILPWFRMIKCSKQKSGQWTYQEFNK